MLISRGVSYYTQLLISAAMTVAASFILRNTNERETPNEENVEIHRIL